MFKHLSASLITLLLVGCGGGSNAPTTTQKSFVNVAWDQTVIAGRVQWVCRSTTGNGYSYDVKYCESMSKNDNTWPSVNVQNPDIPSTVYKGMPIDELCAAPMTRYTQKYGDVWNKTSSQKDIYVLIYEFRRESFLNNFHKNLDYIRETDTNISAKIWQNGNNYIIWTSLFSSWKFDALECVAYGVIDGTRVSYNFDTPHQ